VADKLTPTGIDRLRAIAARHVANDFVPGLVVLVASGDQVEVEPQGSARHGASILSATW
jgi:hypothetical protein